MITAGQQFQQPPAEQLPGPVLQLGHGWFPEQAGGLNRYYHGLLRQGLATGDPLRGLLVGQGAAEVDTVGAVRAVAPRKKTVLRRWRAMRAAVADVRQRENVSLVASHFAFYAFPVRRIVRDLPHVVHFHGPWAAEGQAERGRRMVVGLKKRLEQSVYATADRFIVLSHAFAGVLINDYGIAEQKVDIIPGGVDVPDTPLTDRTTARQHLGWPADRPIVLCVRRLARRMGIDVLIDAVDEVRQHRPDVLVLVAGRGAMQAELQSAIEARGLRDHVRLLGYMADDHLPLAYAAADVSVVPSQSLEGFGMITLESLVQGTPVLVTPVGGLPEAVGGLGDRLILPGVTAAAIADGLRQALLSPASLPPRQVCRDYAVSNFGWPRIYDRVRRVYLRAIAEHAR